MTLLVYVRNKTKYGSRIMRAFVRVDCRGWFSLLFVYCIAMFNPEPQTATIEPWNLCDTNISPKIHCLHKSAPAPKYPYGYTANHDCHTYTRQLVLERSTCLTKSPTIITMWRVRVQSTTNSQLSFSTLPASTKWPKRFPTFQKTKFVTT